MSSWRCVSDLARRLPDAVLGEAHEGSPAFYIGRHQFARLFSVGQGPCGLS